jgi:hypothetical protein
VPVASVLLDGPVLNPAPAGGVLPGAPGDLAAALLAATDALPEGFEDVEALAGALHAVDPFAIVGDAPRIAFYIDLYNALFRHARHVTKIRGHLVRHLRFFSRAAYRVGQARFSLDVIEHGILRRNRRPPGWPLRTLSKNDPRLECAPSKLDPRIHFALHCGARSCPPVHAYDEAKLEEQLDTATRAYFAAEASVDRGASVVTLPALCKLYGRDFGDRAALLGFAVRFLQPEDAAFVRANLARVRVRYATYDWTLV